MSDGPVTSDAAPPPLARWARGAIAAAVVAGLVLRFAARSELWLDEALSVSIAKLPLADIPAALRHDGHPPLYYLVLHLWMRAFGDGDVAVRALSGLFAVAALPLAWLVGKKVGGDRVAWWTLALFALSPFAVRYATEARMYAAVSLLVLVGWLLVRRALVDPRWPWLGAIALTSGLLLLSHYWALWFLASVLLVLAWIGRDDRRAWRVAAAVLAGGVLFVPWLPSMLSQAAHTGTPWASPVRPTVMVQTSLFELGGGDYAEAVLLGFGVLALFALGILGRTDSDGRLVLDGRGRPSVAAEATVVGLTLALGTLTGYLSGTTFAARYIAVIVPLVLLVAAVGAARRPGRAAPAATLAALLVLGAVGSIHHAREERTQAKPIAAAIRAGAGPGDLVVMCPDQLGPAANRLLPSSLAQVTYPAFGDPSRVDWRDYEKRNKAADPVAFADQVAARGAPTVWLIASGSYKTLTGQCEAVTAELTARLGSPQEVVAEDADTYYEHASLLRFGASRPAP